MAKLKRDYYNDAEMNNYMVLKASSQMLEGIRSMSSVKSGKPMAEEWYGKGIITAEQKKNLKMATTYLKKFIDEGYDNRDEKTKKVIDKKSYKFDFRLVDDFTMQKVYSMMQHSNEIHLSREDFYDLVESKMYCECLDCKKDRNNCDTHSLFQKFIVPPPIRSTEEKCNCEYSYDSISLSGKDLIESGLSVGQLITIKNLLIQKITATRANMSDAQNKPSQAMYSAQLIELNNILCTLETAMNTINVSENEA